MQLSVSFRDLALDAGRVFDNGDNRLLIAHPDVSMFEQVCKWLNAQPSSPYTGLPHYVLGIGAAALCLRWGTYLAVLLDNHKPIDPHRKDPAASMISEGEMMRINIEASANLEHVLRLLHEDELTCYHLLERAYTYLPMPQRRVKRNLSVVTQLIGSALMFNAQPSLFKSTPELIERLVAHPYRVLANYIMLWAYRNGNGEVEEVHAGRFVGYSLAHRRVTLAQERGILRGAASRFGAVFTGPYLWDSDLPGLDPWPQNVTGLSAGYPSGWTLDQSSVEIEITTR